MDQFLEKIDTHTLSLLQKVMRKPLILFSGNTIHVYSTLFIHFYMIEH